MTREQFTGILRELLTVLSAAAVTYGFLDEQAWVAITAFIVAVASLIWGIRANEGLEILFTLGRKLISAAAGALLALGVLDAQRVDALMSVALALLAFAWSFASKNLPNPDPPKK